MTAVEVLNQAMREQGNWYGPNGSRNHMAFDVLFAALQHVTRNTDPRAAQFLADRRTGSDAAWLMRGLN
jgi:hypothetical protein